jgi:hypothetical protein
MTALLGALVVIGIPTAAVMILLTLANVQERRRQAVIDRQIDVTDAVHQHFGAIVAPTVQRARRGWRVKLPMDPRDPHAAAVVEIAASTLGGGQDVEVVIVAPWRATRRRPTPQSRERIASAMSA